MLLPKEEASHRLFSYNTSALVDYESLWSPKHHYSEEPAATEPSLLRNVRLEERMCEDAASHSNTFTHTNSHAHTEKGVNCPSCMYWCIFSECATSRA